MKKVFYLLALIYLFLSSAHAINVTLLVKAEGDARPVIFGTTNLPDDVELMITIARKESQYMAQDKVKVKDGAFRSAEFTQKGKSLNPGRYTIEVTMPNAAFQPPNTWPTIGNEGGKLDGPLVKKSPYGGKIVELKTTVTLGSGQISPEQDKAARDQNQRDMHEWWLQSCTNNCKMAQGLAQKQREAFNWDRCYYKCVAEEPVKK